MNIDSIKHLFVPVEERLPEYYAPVPVICYSDDFENLTHHQAWLASDGDRLIWTINETNTTIDVTHWLDFSRLTTKEKAIELSKKAFNVNYMRGFPHNEPSFDQFINENQHIL